MVMDQVKQGDGLGMPMDAPALISSINMWPKEKKKKRPSWKASRSNFCSALVSLLRIRISSRLRFEPQMTISERWNIMASHAIMATQSRILQGAYNSPLRANVLFTRLQWGNKKQQLLPTWPVNCPRCQYISEDGGNSQHLPKAKAD